MQLPSQSVPQTPTHSPYLQAGGQIQFQVPQSAQTPTNAPPRDSRMFLGELTPERNYPAGGSSVKGPHFLDSGTKSSSLRPQVVTHQVTRVVEQRAGYGQLMPAELRTLGATVSPRNYIGYRPVGKDQQLFTDPALLNMMRQDVQRILSKSQLKNKENLPL